MFVQAYIIKNGERHLLNNFKVNEKGEIWREPFIDSIGRSYKGSIKKPSKDKDGYLFINIPVNGKCSPLKIHRIVASTFLETSEMHLEVNHKDGNKENNSVSNLEWLEHGVNMKHACDTNLHVGKGLTKEDAKQIRIYHKEGYSLSEISRMYDVALTTIWKIVHNKTHKEGEHFGEMEIKNT